MRLNLDLDETLLVRARELTGVQEMDALVRLGLEALIRVEAARRLATLGGIDPNASAPSRRTTQDIE